MTDISQYQPLIDELCAPYSAKAKALAEQLTREAVEQGAKPVGRDSHAAMGANVISGAANGEPDEETKRMIPLLDDLPWDGATATKFLMEIWGLNAS